jgi:hypothetical protein
MEHDEAIRELVAELTLRLEQDEAILKEYYIDTSDAKEIKALIKRAKEILK